MESKELLFRPPTTLHRALHRVGRGGRHRGQEWEVTMNGSATQHSWTAPLVVLLTLPFPLTGARAADQAAQVIESNPNTAAQVTATCVLESAPLSATPSSTGPPAGGGTSAYKEVFSLIRVADCATYPAPQTLTLHSISFRVHWLSGCEREVDVSIVESTGGTCPMPDTTLVLCEPRIHTITSPNPQGGRIHTLPLGDGCCIDKDTFVRIRFRDPLICGGTANLISMTNASCTLCRQYYVAPAGVTTITDWCASGVGRSAWISVEADCCESTGALPGSWGRLKSLYR
jgi:hypothetical protein